MGRTITKQAEADLRRKEYAVVGASMDGQLSSILAAGVRPETFFFSEAGRVFKIVCGLNANGKTPDTETILSEFQGKKLDGRPADEVIVEMSESYPGLTFLPGYVGEVKSAWRRRGEILAAAELVQALKEGNKGAIAVARDRLAKWAEVDAPVRPLEIISCEELVARNSPPPPELVEGLVGVGELAMLAAPAKAGKSWFLLQLAMSVAGGVPFIGRPTRQGPVVYVNAEVGEVAWEYRCRRMAGALGIPPPAQLYTANTRGQEVSIANLSERLRATLAANGVGRVGAIVADPFYYLAAGLDENSAGEVSAAMKALQKLAEETGATVIVAHHTGKGDVGGRKSMDRPRGSSAFVGTVDTSLSLVEGAEGRMRLEVNRRNGSSPGPRMLLQDFPLWVDDGEAVEVGVEGPGGRPRKYTVDTLMQCFKSLDERLRRVDFTGRGVDRHAVDGLLAEAVKSGRLVREGDFYHLARQGDA